MSRTVVIGCAIAVAGLSGLAVGASGVLGRAEAVAAPSPVAVEPAPVVEAEPIVAEAPPAVSRQQTLAERLDALKAEREARLKDGRLKIAPPPAPKAAPKPRSGRPARRERSRGADTALRTLTGQANPFVPSDDLRCMTEAIYYEARSESEAGQRAVAQVVLNRKSDPRYPQTVCGVVYEHKPGARTCQFSFTCDGSLNHGIGDQAAWERAGRYASEALSGAVRADTVATHYHTDYVNPRWSRAFQQVAKIGAHIFYDGRGDRDPK